MIAVRSFGTRRRQVFAILLGAIVAATVPSAFFVWVAIGDTKDEIDTERLHLAQFAAAQADRILSETFFEIELASALISSRQEATPSESEGQPLRTLYGGGASLSAGVLFLDGEGALVLAEPEVIALGLGRERETQILADARHAAGRSVSEPFILWATGHVVTALSVPVYGNDGQRMGTVIGLLDLAEPSITDLVEPARRLGVTGHADLVDERGIVLASTEHDHVMTPGDHPDFYQRAAVKRVATVAQVAHEPDGVGVDQSKSHIMAYAPLRNAPWGIAIGASEGETMRTANQLRRRLIILGAASAATLLVGAVLATLRIPAR
ncbi:MAG: cache domain-containing protein, partial [Gammaproteobacteria bacterium]